MATTKKNRDRLIRTFQARTSGRPNTTPANLTKKRGMPAARKFDARQTFTRYGPNVPPSGSSYHREDDPRWVSPRVIPGYGQVRNKQKPQVRRGKRRYTRGPGSSYRSPSAYGRGGPQFN